MESINYYTNIEFENNNFFNGTITYLQKIYGTDLISNNIIKVNVNSPGNTNQSTPVTERDNTKSFYCSSDQEFSYYEVDFLSNNLYLKSYSIRCQGRDYFHTWEIQGSHDGIHYYTIDLVENFEQPSVKYHSQRFICKYPQKTRFVRYQSKGRRSSDLNKYSLYLYRIEFFGYFVPSGLMNGSFYRTSHLFNMNMFLFIAIFFK